MITLGVSKTTSTHKCASPAMRMQHVFLIPFTMFLLRRPRPCSRTPLHESFTPWVEDASLTHPLHSHRVEFANIPYVHVLQSINSYCCKGKFTKHARHKTKEMMRRSSQRKKQKDRRDVESVGSQERERDHLGKEGNGRS